MDASEDPYSAGFLAGQAVAYCERVNTGSGLVAQLVCAKTHADMILEIIRGEGCKSSAVPHECDRVSIWIYRDEVVKRLVEDLHSLVQSAELRMWSMGKLFGYSDREVLGFIERPR
jgi:hypothetical protein